MIKATNLLSMFIEENRWNYEEATIGTYRLAFQHLIEAVGDKDISSIEPCDGEKFKGYCINTNHAKTSANIWLRTICRVFKWASEEKCLIESSPFKRTRQFRITPNPVMFYEDDPVIKMIEVASDLVMKGFILCAWTTGLRRGEILNLTKDNIRNGFIHVEAKKKTAYTWPWEPKTKDIRQVPITDQLAEIIDRLDNYYPFLKPERYQYLLRQQSKGLLKDRQRKCPEGNLRRKIVGIQNSVFGKQIGTVHMFRKTFTTNMAEIYPDHIVMDMTGHRCQKTLLYYKGVRKSYYDQARESIAGRIKKGSLLEPVTLTN